MYIHKYTRRTIAESQISVIAESKSLTPHYDELMKNNNTFKHCTKQINSGKEPPILKGI